MNKQILSVAAAGVWITLSEFVRNEFMFKSHWVAHYTAMGLDFKTLPINGMLWTLWSFLLAYLISRMLRAFSFAEAIGLTYLAIFVMMWISTYNLQVLPPKLLLYGLPLSLLELIIAGLIIRKVAPVAAA